MAKTTNQKSKSAKKTKSDKDRYYDLKRRILSWEKENYTRLAVVETGDGWYKLFDHSAIIYACQIAKRLKIAAKLVSDADFRFTTDTPVCLLKELNEFEEALKSLKIFRSSMEPGVYVYDLGYRVDAGDLVSWQKEEKLLRERANELVLPVEVFPGLRNELKLLTCKIYEVVRKMNTTGRELVGDGLVGTCSKMYVNFVVAANGHTDMRQYLKTTVKDLRLMEAKMLLVSELRLATDNQVYNLLLRIGKAHRKVADALAKTESGDYGH
ncbi:hypothetical protein IJJ02_03425 [Candidatus Saccharibacteria bacterium]|nr:hypothetical protein [Candidatus Saccharibacteria bacterium]